MHRAQRFIGLLAVSLVGCGATDPDSQGAAVSAPLISLNSYTIDTRGPSPSIPAALRVRPGDAAAEQVVLVQFPGPITAEQDRALRRAAAQVYTYLPQYAYLVKLPAGEQSAVGLASTGASWWGSYHPFYKISRAVAAIGPNDPMASGDVGLQKSLMVQVYPDADLDKVVEAIRALGVKDIPGRDTTPRFSRIRLMLTPAEIAARREDLARLPEVFWIDVEPRKALLNDTTIWVGQSGLSGGQTTPVFSKGIYGQGQIVGVLDTGIDADMCYFRDPALGLPPRNECDGGTVVDLAQRKVVAVDFLWSNDCSGGISGADWDDNGHGSHVAGTVGGDNFVSPLIHNLGDGMAPGAKLVIQDGGFQVDACADLPALSCPVVDLKPFFQQAYDQGARVHTNSWGDQEDNPTQNNYTTACQDVDEFMWNHKDFLIIFAAGNSGPGAGSVGSPATAKSTVAVGATRHGTSAGSMATFSSCGPTDDGRIKPEVTVPGQSVVSARSDDNISSSNCNTSTLSGTSMAAPGAAGFSALIRQYYADGWFPSGNPNPADGFAPSAALVRTTLVNSGQPMGGFIPNNCQGWGRVLLENALYFAPELRRLWVVDDAVGFPLGSSDETRSTSYTVRSIPNFPLKISLGWTDFPSTPAANPHINNDLDLEVTGPSGKYFGNVFFNGQSVPGGSPDRKNTLEQVVLTSPLPGEYTVTVRSFNVPNGPQPFALVVTGNTIQAGTPGASCLAAVDCQSGFCVDGVCCNTACSAGVCDACSTSTGAAADGTCSLFTGPACNDGSACTQTDTCQAGVCTGANPVVCPAPDACHDAGTCDAATGACESPTKADGATCDDGSACTQTDACQAGVCTGANPVVCPAPDACHDAGTCDAATGACESPAKADGATCDDGNGCTESDTCQAGVCQAGAPLVCPAPDACHEQGTCDPVKGACESPAKPDGTPCPDGQCKAGTCASIPDGGGAGGSSGATTGSSMSSSSGATTGGTMSGGNGTTTGSSMSGGGSDPGEPGGCGCGVASSPKGGLMSLGVGFLLVLRRRRKGQMN